MEEGKNLIKSEGVQVDTLFEEGHAIEKILETVTKENFYLVVLGSRCLSTLI